MLAFRSEDDVDSWCRRRGLPRGAVMALDLVWELSRAWYAGRAAPTWRGRDAEEATAVLRSVGLDGDFWRL